ncbi:aminomethyl-transferring glycine dehydrogenase subunit GcvPA [Brevibacillus parabrevis]|jgi:Glycine cleavage system protein P (pyridoxal-binding), N-terminal domain|uniref:aminomethyl-transferring glycine dehydrogenase subunit GcvPA n=1 Tax=Brevibacillus parabrevis TaxID=54914 RepID=UPI001F617816|nr:aminomethyl-transferring glycine dehydrogenase subunit GcvPA [Brevibacillus parabrevis]MDR4997509.1 aminomethyl-transferring glycine dehydrogenase subunit GcvPA [Brevibacillus parabrevis]
MSAKPFAHPYIPNSAPAVKEQMLKEIGLGSIEEIFADIPQELRLKEKMNIPPALTEYELERHVNQLMNKNITTKEYISFLGAGCWPHFIPAVCDEINSRAEFLTAYAGEPYEDKGRFQALFEYQSLVAELVDMDVVNVPTFDWAQAASTALRMAARITKRTELLLPKNIHPDKLLIIRNYTSPDLTLTLVDFTEDTGAIDLADLQAKLGPNTAAVYFENPSFLGSLETNGQLIADLAHAAGALCVVGVDPSSLGVMEAPANYGADIVCGDLQPLGVHMHYGGGQSGFIATHDDPTFVMEYPSRLFGIAPTEVEGEYGFGDVAYDRTSFAKREKGKESVGTQTALWGITAGVYLATMGPDGMEELGQGIMQRSQYAAKQLASLPGVELKFSGPFFKEFVIDFSQTGKTVKEINAALLSRGIFGGVDLTAHDPQLEQCALFCVTEVHSKEEIDALVTALASIV